MLSVYIDSEKEFENKAKLIEKCLRKISEWESVRGEESVGGESEWVDICRHVRYSVPDFDRKILNKRAFLPNELKAELKDRLISPPADDYPQNRKNLMGIVKFYLAEADSLHGAMNQDNGFDLYMDDEQLRTYWAPKLDKRILGGGSILGNVSLFLRRANRREQTILESPVILFELLDKPLLNVVYLNTLTEKHCKSSSAQGVHPIVKERLKDWMGENREGKTLKEAREFAESVQFGEENKMKRAKCCAEDSYKIVQLLLFYTFYLSQKAHNTSVHNSDFFIELGKKTRRQLEADGEKKSNIYELFPELNENQKWYYEMCVGLSLTAALTSAFCFLKEKYPQDIEEKGETLYFFLELFRNEIISCPAPFFRTLFYPELLIRIYESNAVLSLEDLNKKLKGLIPSEKDERIKDAKQQIWMHVEQLVATTRSGLDEDKRILETSILNKKMLIKEPARGFLPAYFMWGDKSPLFSGKPDSRMNYLAMNGDAEWVFDQLYNPAGFGKFPFEFCPCKLPKFEYFNAPKLPRDKRDVFERIHSILYPEGYQLVQLSEI